MDAKTAVKIISTTIEHIESEAFAETVEARREEGWANPTLQAQSEWQGYDNQIVFGDFQEALQDLLQYDSVPTGCKNLPEGNQTYRHLVRALATAGTIGTGDPVAYVGVDGYFTLIRASATEEDVAQAAAECFPGDD